MKGPVANPTMIGTGDLAMDRIKGARLCLIGLTLFISSFAQADVVRTTSRDTTLQPLSEQEASATALQWGLARKEWREYEAIMSGKRGIWSPGLDPITVLGIHAESLAERNHYADLYVKTEFARVEGELAFQRAVDAAWKRNFGDVSRIASFKRSISGEPVERYGIVVKRNCDHCVEVAQKHIALLSTSDHLNGVDIYVADSEGEEGSLRQWVSKNQILINRIRDGSVTINHGEAYADLDHYPKIFAKEIGGQWVEQ